MPLSRRDCSRPSSSASGGRLFLAEVDALPLALQGKVLTAIEARRVRRVGALTEHRRPFRADCGSGPRRGRADSPAGQNEEIPNAGKRSYEGQLVAAIADLSAGKSG